MEIFKDRIFLSQDGDKLIASFDGKSLHFSVPGILLDVELSDVQNDNWYENGNIRMKLEGDELHVSNCINGFPTNTVKYLKF